MNRKLPNWPNNCQRDFNNGGRKAKNNKNLLHIERKLIIFKDYEKYMLLLDSAGTPVSWLFCLQIYL